MRQHITYIADDGTVFDTEGECIEYEKAQSIGINSVAFFDDRGIIFENPSIDQIETVAWYMKVFNADSAKELFMDLARMYSFDPPHCEFFDEDILRWDAEADGWENMTKTIAELTELRDKIERQVNGVG